jgi:hypothetical protein
MAGVTASSPEVARDVCARYISLRLVADRLQPVDPLRQHRIGDVGDA